MIENTPYTREGRISNRGDGVGNGNGGKITTALEYTTNAGHAVGNGNEGKATISERAIANAGHAVGNGD